MSEVPWYNQSILRHSMQRSLQYAIAHMTIFQQSTTISWVKNVFTISTLSHHRWEVFDVFRRKSKHLNFDDHWANLSEEDHVVWFESSMEMDPVVGLFGQQCLDGVNCYAASIALLIYFSALLNKKAGNHI